MNNRNISIVFLKRLNKILIAGYSVPEALRLIAQKEKKPKKRLQVEKIQTLLSGGYKLGGALHKVFGSRLSKIILAYIEIGEASGALMLMLERGLSIEGQIANLRKSIIKAIFYPVFILGVSIVVISIVLLFIMPKLLPIFRDLRVDLPMSTKFFLALSSGISNYGIYFLGLLTVVVVAMLAGLHKIPQTKIWLEHTILNIYGIKHLYILYQSGITAFCIAGYLDGGYSLGQSLNEISENLRSNTYSVIYKNIALSIQEGTDVQSAFSKFDNLFPNWEHELGIAIVSGHLAVQFKRFGEDSLAEIENIGDKIKQWAEPVLLLIIGIFIALFAVSVISPIYESVQNFRV
jgi:type II secretory pathway component PulF